MLQKKIIQTLKILQPNVDQKSLRTVAQQKETYES